MEQKKKYEAEYPEYTKCMRKKTYLRNCMRKFELLDDDTSKAKVEYYKSLLGSLEGDIQAARDMYGIGNKRGRPKKVVEAVEDCVSELAESVDQKVESVGV